MNTQILKLLKSARRVSTPLVAVSTPDPGATVTAFCEAINGGDEFEKIEWDVIRGMRPRNKPAKKFVDAVCADAGGMDPTRGNAIGVLEVVEKMGEGAVLFIHLAHKWIESNEIGSHFLQALWNLRDECKATGKMIVLLGPGFVLPAEIAGDVLMIDEPLPCAAELEGIVRSNAKLFRKHMDSDVSDECVEKAVEAVQGLPNFQADQTVAMCFGKDGLDVGGLWDEKRKRIQQTPGLKCFREGVTFADIGGTENAKQFVSRIMQGNARPNAVVFIDEIEKMMGGSRGDTSGVSQDQLGTILSYMQDEECAGMILLGPPGCLAFDTKLRYRRGTRNSSRELTIQNLHEKFHGIPVTGEQGKCVPWHRPCNTFLHSYHHESGTVFYNRILNTFFSGKKPCIRVVLTSGESVRMTREHMVLTPNGFIAAGDLEKYQDVTCRGSMKASKSQAHAPKSQRVIINSLKWYSSGMVSHVTEPTTGKVYEYKNQTRARLVLESIINSMSYEEYIARLKSDPASINLKTIEGEHGPSVEVHHKNEDSMDDRPENLEILTKSEHTKRHDPLSRFGVEYTNIEQVVHIENDRDVNTYDIQMESPANNFATADGLFVHNSGKSMLAKAAGNEGGIPTVQLDLGACKGSLVGESERQLRHALKVITSISNGKSLWLATCNSLNEMPPELRRRFKLGTFFFDLPSKEERLVIWRMYIKKFGLAVSAGNGPGIDDDGWTGAEISQACEVAWRLGCGLDEAAGYVVPVARSAGQQIEALRRHADGRFLSASYKGVYKFEVEEPEAGKVKHRKLMNNG